MKTVKRVVFSVLLLTLCTSGFLSLFTYYDLYSRNISRDFNLLVPVLAGVFSFIGFLFSIKKFTSYFNTETIIYKFLRIGDLIFSILTLVFILYFFFDGLFIFIEKYRNREISTFIFVIRFIFVLFLLLISIIYTIDNFKYHKEQKTKEALLKNGE